MKIIVKRSPLMDFLADLNAISERKTTQPILGHVLLQADHSGLTLRTTDTEISLTVQLGIDEIQLLEEGSTTVSVSKLLDIIRHQPADALIEFRLENDILVVQSALNAFRLITLPAQDFPSINDVEIKNRVQIQSKALHSAMNKVRFSIADQDSRHYLNGLHFRSVEDGKALQVVSSDGHRLSCVSLDLDNPVSERVHLIVPKKAVGELMKLLARQDEMVTLELGQRELMLTVGAYRLKTRLIDSEFPNYEHMIPVRVEQPILVSKANFIEALTRAKILLTDKNNAGVRLNFKDHALRISARNLANETVEEQLDVINPAGLELEISLNINYLLHCCGHMESENIQLNLTSPQSPCLMTSGEDRNIRYVIMSLRI